MKNNKVIKTPKQGKLVRKIQAIVGALTIFLTPTIAAAGPTKNFGALADGLVTQVSSIKTLLITIAGVAGLGLVLMGILTLVKDPKQKQAGDVRKGIAMIIGGAALIGIATFVLIAQQSLLGSTDTTSFDGSGSAGF